MSRSLGRDVSYQMLYLLWVYRNSIVPFLPRKVVKCTTQPTEFVRTSTLNVLYDDSYCGRGGNSDSHMHMVIGTPYLHNVNPQLMAYGLKYLSQHVLNINRYARTSVLGSKHNVIAEISLTMAHCLLRVTSALKCDTATPTFPSPRTDVLGYRSHNYPRRTDVRRYGLLGSSGLTQALDLSTGFNPQSILASVATDFSPWCSVGSLDHPRRTDVRRYG
jgi:hypothetical protein